MQASTKRSQKPSHSSYLAWLVCVTGGLLFFYEFIQLNLMNSLNPFISSSLHLSPAAISSISAMYFIANASLVFVAGNLLDRYSNKSCILFATALCTIGTFGFYWAQTAWQLGALRFIIGIGGAFCFISAFRLATRWFPVERLAFITGIIVTIAMAGGMIAQGPATMLMQAVGWREAMLFNGALGVVIMLLMIFIIKDAPDMAVMQKEQQAVKSQGLRKPITEILSNMKIWGAALYGSFLNLAVFIIGALWGTRYLMSKYGFSINISAHICGMIYFGSMIGCPLIGYLSDRFFSQKKLMIIFSIASLLALLAIIYLPLTYSLLMILFFSFGVLTSSQVLSYPYAAAQASSLLKGTSASIVSTCMELLPAIFQPVFGWLLMTHAKHQGGTGINLQPSDYTFALNLLLIGFGISIVLSFILPRITAKAPVNDTLTDAQEA